MCYSAMIQADYDVYVRRYGATMSLEEFAANVWNAPNKKAKKSKRLRAMEDWLRSMDDPQAQRIWQQILAERAERETWVQQEIFKQTRRKADAERALQVKVTKKEQENLRIASDKIPDLVKELAGLRRTDSKETDARFYPGMYAPVIVLEDGKRVIKPMRYHCRLPGWDAAYEKTRPGTYNARRDKISKVWPKLFGVRHGVIVVNAFYEHVERHKMEHRELAPGEESQDVKLEFRPEPAHDMVIACFWNESPEGDGHLLSFAAITDDPAPEVAAAGHDRTIIEIKPERIDEWLTPGLPKATYQALLDDRPEAYYGHHVEREAA